MAGAALDLAFAFALGSGRELSLLLSLFSPLPFFSFLFFVLQGWCRWFRMFVVALVTEFTMSLQKEPTKLITVARTPFSASALSPSFGELLRPLPLPLGGLLLSLPPLPLAGAALVS